MKRFFLYKIFILFAFFSQTLTVNAFVLKVTSTSDGAVGSLRSQITAASPGDTVIVDISGLMFLSSNLTINKSITIIGPSAAHFTFDANSYQFIISTAGASLINIEGIKFINSPCPCGPFFKIDVNATANIKNCTFENLQTGTDGGAIDMQGNATLNVFHCSFFNCISTGNGGAISVTGGNTMVATNCTFFNNTAVNGGAVYNSGGIIKLINNTFYNNTASANGHSVAGVSGASVTVQNNLFTDGSAPKCNSVCYSGGGPNWSSNGGNVFSTITPYGFITFSALDVYNVSFAAMALRATAIVDGYGLKYYTLLGGSGAIDKGTTGVLVPLTDTRRAPRAIYGSLSVNPDAGACEYTPYTVTALTGAQSFSNKVTALNATINPPPYYIDFDIAAPGTTSLIAPVTISKASTFIDGYTQNGSKVNGPGPSLLTVSPFVLPNIISGTGGTLINVTGNDFRVQGLDFMNTSVALASNGITNMFITGNRFRAFSVEAVSLLNCINVAIGGRNHWDRNVFGGNSGSGIKLTTCSSINIKGNFIGVDPTGTIGDANNKGIVLSGSTAGTIGGNHLLGEGNIISGNVSCGIEAIDSDGIIYVGNYVGLEYNGNGPIPNQTYGIFVNSTALPSSIKIGLLGLGLRNYICNSDPASTFSGAGIKILNHTAGSIQIYNNYIGLNVSNIAGPNATGLTIINSSGISMGDGTSQRKNIVSGNAGIGIYMDGANCNGNYFNKNFIGIKNDNSPAPNGSIGFHVVNGAQNSTIINNVVASSGGGTSDGVFLNAAGINNSVSGNFIGTDSSGTIARPNFRGISISASLNGNIFSSNIISGNADHGIFIDNTPGVQMYNNDIGVNVSTTTPLPNVAGIFAQSSNGLDIHANTIGGNSSDGIFLGACNNASIKSNYIGTNSTGIDLHNNFGISIYFASSGNIIGGLLPMDRNTIARNLSAGINIQREAFDNGVLGNTFFQNGGMAISLNSASGFTPFPNDLNDPDVHGPAAPNVGNDGQNKPTNVMASLVGPTTHVSGTANVDDGTASYYFQVYKINPGNVDASGFGEGDTLIGTTTVIAPGTNTFNFTIPVVGLILGDIVSATCSKVTGPIYSTSEFADTSGVRSGLTATVIDSIDITCNGASNGFAQAGVTSGIGPYNYAWFKTPAIPMGITTDTIGSLGPGTYFCIVTDIGCGCSDTSNFVTISQPPVLSVVATPLNATCFGTCNGSITLSAFGGTMPYVYSIDNGSTYFASPSFTALCAGIYNYVAKDSNGCVTAFGVSTTVNQPPILSSSTTSVSNESCAGLADGTFTIVPTGGSPTYSYSKDGGATFVGTATFAGLAPGVYNYVLKDLNGCTTGGIVTILAGPTVTVNAGLDVSICIGTTSLSLSGTSSTTVTWTTNGTGSFLPSTTVLNPTYILGASDTSLSGLVFVLTTGVVGSCGPLSDTLVVTFSAGPDPTFGYSSSTFCSNDPSSIPTAATPAGYFDVVGGLGVTMNTLTGEIYPSLSIPGTYNIYHEFTSPCYASDTVTIVILAAPVVNIVPQHLGCYGDTIQFVGTPGGGTWSGITFGLNATTGQWINWLSGAGFQTVTYTYTDITSGCTAIDTNKIFIRPAPVVSITGVAGPYCPSDGPFTVVGVPAGGLFLLNGSIIGTSTFTYDPTTVGKDTISYIYQDPVTTCFGYTQLIINVNATPAAPILSAIPPFEYCGTSPTTISVSNPSSTVGWFFDAGISSLITTGVSISTSILPGGTNTIYVANLVGSTCASPPTPFTFTNYDASLINFGGPYVNCPGAATSIVMTLGAGLTYTWVPDSSLSSVTAINPIVNPKFTTTYYVLVNPTSLPGCTIVDSVTVVVQPCSLDDVTNAFTPDGDGVNDTWIINGIQLHPDNSVVIFNRWGNKMLEFHNYDNVTTVWDGKYKGSLVAAGTYYFIIQFFDDGQQKAGWIQINY